MEKEITIKAHAKINLFLDITGVLDNSYHAVNSVMQSVGIFDIVRVSCKGEGIKVSCSDKSIPAGGANSAYKAARLFLDANNMGDIPVSIHIEKNIPTEAGLGGESADAAAVLFALNKILGTGLSEEELCGLGSGVGADVPFCIAGGTQFACGFGEKLEKLRTLCGFNILLARPRLKVSTIKAFKLYDNMEIPVARPCADSVKSFVQHSDIKNTARSMFNIFEHVIKDSSIDKIKAVMKNAGAYGAGMTGSGPVVAGIFAGESGALKAQKELMAIADMSVLTVPVGKSLEVIG